MKRRMSYRINSLMKVFSLVAVACLLSITAAYAGDPEGVGGGSDDLDGENTKVPFDGGVSILVAAGVAYGARKAYQAKQKSKTTLTEENMPM